MEDGTGERCIAGRGKMEDETGEMRIAGRGKMEDGTGERRIGETCSQMMAISRQTTALAGFTDVQTTFLWPRQILPLGFVLCWERYIVKVISYSIGNLKVR